MSQKDGTTEEHGDMVDRSGLMMDARTWLASSRHPAGLVATKCPPRSRRW